MHYKLTEEIKALSVSKLWETAKKEWFLVDVYMSEDPQQCLCGHYPIIETCILKNSKNNNITEVGNCCVNKFLGIESANKIFASVKKVKKDLSKSMNTSTLDFLIKKNAITDNDYKFYSDIHKKRKLTNKQTEYKKSINRKLLASTCSDESIINKINKVLKWAKNNPNFNKLFVISLQDQYAAKKYLSDKQVESLDKIIQGWKIVS